MTGRSTSTCESRPWPGEPLGLLLFVLATQLLCGCAHSEVECPRPPTTDQAVIRAQGLLRLGDPQASLAEIEEVLAAEPEHFWAHRVRQDALLASDRAEEARDQYLALALERPQQVQYAYLAGRVLLPDADVARPYFDECLRIDPDSAWGYIGLARLEVIRGDMFQAIRIHEEAAERLADDPDLQLSLGTLYLQLRLPREAQRAFDKVLRERPWEPQLHAGLGRIHAQLERNVEAVEQIETALSLDPSRTDLMGVLARVHYDNGDPDRAWEVCVHQQEVDGSADPWIVWNLEAITGNTMPQFAALGPRYLDGVTPWGGGDGR